jgi:hypothetical protein
MLLSSTVIVGAAATTHADVPFFVDDICDGSWTEYNHDFVGSRTNNREHILSKSNVGGLKIKWQYPAAGPVNGTPIVADGTVYIGDATSAPSRASSASRGWRAPSSSPAAALHRPTCS